MGDMRNFETYTDVIMGNTDGFYKRSADSNPSVKLSREYTKSPTRKNRAPRIYRELPYAHFRISGNARFALTTEVRVRFSPASPVRNLQPPHPAALRPRQRVCHL